jgi:CheY-like chemotaxis protein
MDIWMPVGLGLSVAQRLRDLGLQSIPVIFITASRLKGLREAAAKLGAVGYFEKPYDPEQLLAAIQKALDRSTHKAASVSLNERVLSMPA